MNLYGWPESELWRAPPPGHFPPSWASVFGDDSHGLWADLAVGPVVQRMRWIEPTGPEGFLMGSTQEERNRIKDKTSREWADEHECEPQCVVIKNGFWLADTPCTQALWSVVMGNKPSHFKKGADAPQRPVENVSFVDVNTFLRKLLTLLPTDSKPELPTEAEWEYAARAGTATAYWWGDEPDSNHANWSEEQNGTTPVKRYPASPWGLYDVHGNIWEWCSDQWRSRLDAPDGATDANCRVVRGGSWFNHPCDARAALRDGRRRGYRPQVQGFRLVLRSSGARAKHLPGGRRVL